MTLMQKKSFYVIEKNVEKNYFLKTDIFFFYNRHTGLIVLIKKSVNLSEVDMKKSADLTFLFS